MDQVNDFTESASFVVSKVCSGQAGCCLLLGLFPPFAVQGFSEVEIALRYFCQLLKML